MRIFLLLSAVIAGMAVTSAEVRAQQFKVDDAASADVTPVAQLKPATIVFSDRSNEAKGEAADIFIPYEDWAKAKPLQQQALSLYPGYSEPNDDVVIDGEKKHYRQKLQIYVAQARFLLGRAPDSIDLGHFVALPFVQQLDPAIKDRLITSADLARPTEPRMVHNQNPQRPWCEGRPPTICIHSSYKLEGRIPTGIALANKIRESGKQISDTLEFDSQLTMLTPAEVDQQGLARLTGLATPSIGALQQSIFYVNQVIEFGKMLAVFQRHPADAQKTVATVFVALAIDASVLTKRKEYAQVPVLRNLVPAQVLAGKSSFNSGNSLSAGLPEYARNQIKAIAAALEKG
jgi:hypothetical protein